METESHGADILRTIMLNRLRITSSGLQLVFLSFLSLPDKSIMPVQMMVGPSIDQLQTADVSISKVSSTIKLMIAWYDSTSFWVTRPLKC